ncbi:MAG: cysteine hydrolase, partial [Rhodospirillales bacterium]|nr:cysteine hydrolase [Rhodospirillales bacterium]
ARIRRPFPLVTRSVPRMSVRPGNTVLLIQDMQRFLADAQAGMADVARHRGVSTEFDEYYQQVAAAIGNIADLRDHLAGLGITSCHTRWVGERPALMTSLQRALDILPRADDAAAQIVAPLAPADGTDVFLKGGLSAFSSSTLSAALAERRIENIIVCGVIAEFGIQATALQAMDLGYRPLIVGDCCAAMTHAAREATLDGLSFGVAKVRPWRELCYNLDALKHDDVAVL